MIRTRLFSGTALMTTEERISRDGEYGSRDGGQRFSMRCSAKGNREIEDWKKT
jgi:hypothetical protein